MVDAILDFLGTYLDHPWRVLGGLYNCNICCDLCSNFSIVNVSIFGTFGWKVPIHAPKNGVLELLDPLSGLQY